MITTDELLSIVNVVRWPVVLLVLGIVCLILFKSDISELLKRLRRAKLPRGIELLFGYGEAPIDKGTELPSAEIKPEPGAKPEEAKVSAIKWRNSGNVFWLGHDLVWTIDVLLRGGPREHIVHGLGQSLHHLRSLGFVGTPFESRLARLQANEDSSLEKDWTRSERSDYTKELASLVRAIGDLAEANQPDFQPGPKE